MFLLTIHEQRKSINSVKAFHVGPTLQSKPTSHSFWPYNTKQFVNKAVPVLCFGDKMAAGSCCVKKTTAPRIFQIRGLELLKSMVYLKIGGSKLLPFPF